MEEYKLYLNIIKRKLGSNETRGDQLYHLCKQLNLPITGVYASDEKHKNFKNNTCFIVNTDRKGEAGTHWICGVNHNKKTYLYDSFGRNNLYFPSLQGRKVIYTNPDKEQLEQQTDCGQRCISALLVFYHNGLNAYLSL
jgi:hypothetical protein